MILVMLWSNVILTPASSLYAYKWEIVGFRAAWVSISQLPLIYCLSCKINIISLITGISYERLNWLHRWVARTLFLTVIVHWSFFFREWVIADFVDFEISMMPMVKYGFGAWGLIGWMVLSSFGFFRAAGYEFFVFQHLASAGILLWLLYIHVPSYAAYNIWLAIGFVAFDRGSRLVWIVGRNLHLFARTKRFFSHRRHYLGYMARLKSLPKGFVWVTIEDVDFSWKSGQHIYVSIPSIGFVEFHPFTIANEPKDIGEGGTGLIKLYVKVHSGFTRRLERRARGSTAEKPLRIFISGPWGNPPSVEAFETVILIGTSSGVSFTAPIFQSLARKPFCVRRIYFHWIVRDPQQISCFSDAIRTAIPDVHSHGIEVVVSVHITGSRERDAASSKRVDAFAMATEGGKRCFLCNRELGRMAFSASMKEEEKPSLQEEVASPDSSESSCASSSTEPCLCSHAAVTMTTAGRPSMNSLIRKPVEEAYGETAILGCGGCGFNAELRNYVSRLSDERAVHKGTGAQGIFLFTESFGW